MDFHGENHQDFVRQALDSMFETTSLLPDAALSDVVGALGRNLRTDRAPWQRHFGGKAPGFSERFSMKTIEKVGFPISFRLQSNEVVSLCNFMCICDVLECL